MSTTTVTEDSAVDPYIDKETLRKLMQPSLSQWLSRTLGDWLVVVIPMAVAGYTQHWGAYVLAVIGAGVGQHRIALMAHEGSHRQVCRNKRLNDFLVGFFCLWPFANPVGGYRRFHFNHHRYLNTEGDPELHHKTLSSPAWNLPARKKHIVKYFLQDICLLHAIELFRLTQNPRPPISRWDHWAPSIWWACAFGTIVCFQAWWVLAVWFAGTALVFWPIFRLRIWTEHVGTHDVHRIHVPWYWMRAILVPHNTWYHYEHHHFPQVPCWNLPKVRQIIGDSPRIMPAAELFELFRTAPPILSGAPTRTLEKKPDPPTSVIESYVPHGWTEGRLTGIGAGVGGKPVYHSDDVVREHAPRATGTTSSRVEAA
jgi:fatty acid desaturase